MTAREFGEYQRRTIEFMPTAADAREQLREVGAALNAVSSQAVRVRFAAQERDARTLVLASLPRGFKWIVDHPRLLRVLKRVRLWRPPVLSVRR